MLIAATRYRDCEAALGFLTGVLGLTEQAVFRDDAGRIVHAQLVLGQGMLMFGPEQGGAFDALMVDPAETGGRATVSLYAVVPEIASLHARAVAAGAEILIAPKTEDYGGESFTLRDPGGHIWTVGTYDPFATS